mmetsp:Transcript_9000/g.25119  ORF Transcript_9000/g.25119 Transcript_9000/m.25119 type:complete len:185 (-) Transcript_9000:7-561(-)
MKGTGAELAQSCDSGQVDVCGNVLISPHRNWHCHQLLGGSASFVEVHPAACGRHLGIPVGFHEAPHLMAPRSFTAKMWFDGPHSAFAENDPVDDHVDDNADDHDDDHEGHGEGDHALGHAADSFKTCLMALVAAGAAFVSSYVGYSMEKEHMQHLEHQAHEEHVQNLEHVHNLQPEEEQEGLEQ